VEKVDDLARLQLMRQAQAGREGLPGGPVVARVVVDGVPAELP
jgi:hypothetical protein